LKHPVVYFRILESQAGGKENSMVKKESSQIILLFKYKNLIKTSL